MHIPFVKHIKYSENLNIYDTSTSTTQTKATIKHIDHLKTYWQI